MARTGYSNEPPSYYPPRARWHTRLLFNAARPIRRHVDLDRLRPSTRLPPGLLILSLAVPGFSFLVCGRRLLGWSCLAAWLLAAGVFIGALGFPAGGVAYGLAISLHAMSIVFLEALWVHENTFGKRLTMTLLTLVAVWGLMYEPLVRFAERRWVMPLRVGNRVMIVQRGIAPQSIKRGDWLAYEIPRERSLGAQEEFVHLGAGFGIDPVLALPGDRVRFTPQGVLVNGTAVSLAPHMPTEGEIVVPKKVWFIWPSLAIEVRGRVPEANISATLQRTAMVKQEQIIGRPSRHWFGRRQWP